MNRRIKEIFRNLKGINLEKTEKSRMRDSILAYAKERPLPEVARSRLSIFDYLFLNPLPRMAAAVLIVSLGFGSIATVAAENALPGEFLHPVKIKINENIRSFLARSPYAKAEWEVERANRRLVEVEKLAETGKLEAKTIQEAKKRFEDHVQRASAEMAKEEKERGGEIQSTLGALFLVHQDVLGTLIKARIEKEEVKEETRAELRGLRDNVKDKLKIIIDNDLPREKEEKRVEKENESAFSFRALEASPSSSLILPRSAAGGKLTAAENKIEEARKFIDLKKGKVSQNTLLEAENLLRSARDSVNAGKAKIDSDEFNDAFVLFQKAIFQAQTSQRLMAIAEDVFPAKDLKGFEGRIKTEGNDREIKIKVEIKDEEDENKGEGEDQKGGDVKGAQDERGDDRQNRDSQRGEREDRVNSDRSSGRNGDEENKRDEERRK